MFIMHDNLYFLGKRNKENYLSIGIYGYLLVPNVSTLQKTIQNASLRFLSEPFNGKMVG